MKPILFSENSTTFTTNGIGRLADAISCVATEERNGMYELEMEYPVDGQHYSDIGIRKIIVAIPCDGGTLQAFRIYQISKPINGRVMINARHISYDLSKNTCMPFSVASSTSACATTLANLKSKAVVSCPFTFWTDVTTGAGYTQTVPASIKSRLGGVEGSVLDQFGGEFEWDNFAVKLHNQRGRLASTTNISLRYGKNITDFSQEENISETVVGVVPYWADTDGNIVTLTEKVVYNATYKDRYSQRLVTPLDLSDKFESAPSEADLRAAAQVVVNAQGFGLPKVSIEVSFVALWQTEEYKDIAPLQRVKLCDEVTVNFEKLGVDVTAKVVKTEYDVLAERYRSIQIGSVKSNLATTINDQEAANVKAIVAQAVATHTAINNATKWLTSTGGYVIAVKNNDGSWKELLFIDKSDPSEAKHGIRINNAGIGFWDKDADGGNIWSGPYHQAWTIGGNLLADYIHGGTLTLGGNNNGNGVMSFVDANSREIIRIDRTGAYIYSWVQVNGVWTKTTIGSWTPSGINIGKGSIHGASLTLGANGGNNNNDGTITIYGWNTSTGQREVIGTWDKNGISVKKGSISGGSIDGASLTLGGANNASGTLTIKDTSDNVVGTWNNGGINVKKGAISGTTITSKDSDTNTRRTTTITGGEIEIRTPSGGVYDQMTMYRGDEYVQFGAHRVFWNDGDGHSMNATWEHIIEAANRSS